MTLRIRVGVFELREGKVHIMQPSTRYQAFNVMCIRSELAIAESFM
jgi:hypothetical protein